MASIGLIETTVSTEVASTSTSFTEVVESSALAKSTTYYVICHALCEGDANGKVFEWRLVDRTNSDTVLSNSTLKREMNAVDKTQSYAFVGRFTTGTGSGGIAFEQKAAETKTVRTQYLSMVILELSELDSSDYFYANDTTAASHTGSFVDRATLTVSSPTSDDTYLMFAWVATDTNKVANNSEMQLEKTGGSTTTTPLISYEGEDLTEVLSWWVTRPYTMTDDSTTWTIQTRDDDASGLVNEYLESTIFGLRLNAFENFNSSYTDIETVTTSTTWVELKSLSITPDTTGDIVAVGSSVFRPQSTNRRSYQRITVAGASKPNTAPESEFNASSNDGTDLLGMPQLTTFSGTASSASTVDLDVKKTASANIGWKQYALSLFTTEIKSTPAPINYSAVATQTFASGDVASQSYNSGDVASETFNSGDVASEVNPS